MFVKLICFCVLFELHFIPSFCKPKPIFGLTFYHGLVSDYENVQERPNDDHPLSLRARSSFHRDEEQNHLSPFIVGGDFAAIGEAPYQLSLRRDGHHVCGASLVITPGGLQFAITAAHCITKTKSKELNPAKEYTIRGGSNNKYAGQTLDVKSFVRHPKYDGGLIFDLGLVFFKGQFTLSDDLKPVDLPQGGAELTVKSIKVTGWGTLGENEDTPTQLQVVQLPIVENKACEEQYVKYFRDRVVIEDTSLCAGVTEGGKDACKGDSGGPGVAEGPHGPILVAVTSWGKGCGRSETSGVFMRTSKFINWIDDESSQKETEYKEHRELL